MSDVKEKYQQQILFETSNELNDKTQIVSNHEQIVFNNDDWQKDDQSIINELDKLKKEEKLIESKPRWLWRTVGLLFTGLVVVQAFDYFTQGFIESPFTTTIVAAISVCISIIAGATLFRELHGLRQYKRQQIIKNQVAELLDEQGNNVKAKNANALELCHQISENLPGDVEHISYKYWQDSIQDEHNEQEILIIYSRQVLNQLDKKAIKEIAKFSTESVVLVALSPVAIIDMMIMLWRNLRMIDKISGLYGLNLGYWSRLKLIKQVFVNMVYAGASEMITDVGADMLGADLLGKMSGRFAQGLGAGMLTARLGLKVMKLARPISYASPLLIHDEPKIGEIRKAIVSQVTALIKNKT